MPESAACDALGSISIDLLPGGQVRLSSAFMGRQDSLYAPMAQERLATEVPRLLTELRGRVSSTDFPRGRPYDDVLSEVARESGKRGWVNPEKERQAATLRLDSERGHMNPHEIAAQAARAWADANAAAFANPTEFGEKVGQVYRAALRASQGQDGRTTIPAAEAEQSALAETRPGSEPSCAQSARPSASLSE